MLLVALSAAVMAASCTGFAGLSKNNPAQCASPRSVAEAAAKAARHALGDVPAEAELCSATPSAACKSAPASPPDAAKLDIADAFSLKKHPRVPDLAFPVAGGQLSSPFGYRRGVFHRGLDISAAKGVPVVACADGEVKFTGSRKGYRSYGRTVLIDHGKDVRTHYAHLSKILVKKGDKVKKGQTIALVGNTGRSTSPHLHLEVSVGNRYYNPHACFAPAQLEGVQVAQGFGRTAPMGPVRSARRAARR